MEHVLRLALGLAALAVVVGGTLLFIEAVKIWPWVVGGIAVAAYAYWGGCLIIQTWRVFK